MIIFTPRMLSIRRLALYILPLSFCCFQFLSAQPVFQHAIGAEGFEKGSSVRLLPDGGFILGGETQSYGLPERDMLLIRTDSTGHVLWTQSYGGPEREVINDVVQIPDLGYM